MRLQDAIWVNLIATRCQAIFYSPLDPVRTGPTPARITSYFRAELRGDNGLVATGAERLTQVLLRGPVPVYIGGVKKVDAGLQGGVHGRFGAGLVEAATKVVAADTNNADIEVADSSRIQNRVSPVYNFPS